MSALVLSGCATFNGHRETVRNIVFPCEYVGNIDKTGFNEPSGAVFHAGRGTLFVVGDAGDIVELDPAGEVVKQAHIQDADFEGVTWDPASGLLYVAVEGQERILEVDAENFDMRRSFAIPIVIP